MILAVDCGNTRIKWGLHENGGWRAQGALALADAHRLAGELPAPPEVVVMASVAGADVGEQVLRSLQPLGARLIKAASRAEGCGVVNRYERPEQLGVDRWAALIGARHLHSGPCLVVNAGTATTVDVLGADGVFEGGLILPGFDLMRASLAANTARLPFADGSARDLPRNTADAIVSGCTYAQVGAVEGMFRHIAGKPWALCIVSGGAAKLLVRRLALPYRLIDNLVLEGLVRIALAMLENE